MNRSSPAHFETAKRLLDEEDPGQGVQEGRSAAGRVCERVCLHMALVVGADAALALFSRSIQLVQVEHLCLARIAAMPQQIDRLADRLHDCLLEQEPAAATEIAVALIATFLGLLARLVGDRLTEEALRGV